jgi:predicted nucleic acid-binding protein
VTEVIAERMGRWAGGRWAGEGEAKGRKINIADGLIAATALEHDLTVVTRNTRDFASFGIAILNPWE